MEEQFNKQDELLKKLLKETPLDKPSPLFLQKVMQKVEATASKQAYQPLISKWGILAIVLSLMAGCLWLYFNPGSSLIDTNAISWRDKIQFSNPFENLKVSKTTVYAIGFMALFLLQIPILKRLIEKRYS
jgi:hypothetical protein